MNNLEKDIEHIRLLFSEALGILNNLSEEDSCNDLSRAKSKIDEGNNLQKTLFEKYSKDVLNEHLAEVNQVAKLIQKKLDNIIMKLRLDMDETSSELEKLNNKKKLALYKR